MIVFECTTTTSYLCFNDRAAGSFTVHFTRLTNLTPLWDGCSPRWWSFHTGWWSFPKWSGGPSVGRRPTHSILHFALS